MGELHRRLSSLGLPVEAVKTRLHGDFHLGQVLIAGSDVMLTGFGRGQGRESGPEGALHSPLKDVAGLLRSIDRSAASVARLTAERPEDLAVVEPLVDAWRAAARGAFLEGYREGIAGCPVWPTRPGDAERLITLFCLEKATQELREELASRPERIGVPIAGLLQALARPEAL